MARTIWTSWPSCARNYGRTALLPSIAPRSASNTTEPRDAAAFLARDERGTAVGFGEVTLRHDYVNGCDTSPVAFLEGLFVIPSHRSSGVARALCEVMEAWGRENGCTEFGSDALLSNAEGQNMHAALGFEERERVVYYRKML
ncbi:hypothetical protein GCM10009764_14530 [Nocardia ninae]|uniref:N-acetyltransferase domain-containing protein n=1 Tax=Nocardia ninae NBRC 108245 TaxID=1210091 RepID=A0A511MUC7_9NOCA|nr:hypothetical protein NN4_85100 [Nocardia ninae NBRC 108245]